MADKKWREMWLQALGQIEVLKTELGTVDEELKKALFKNASLKIKLKKALDELDLHGCQIGSEYSDGENDLVVTECSTCDVIGELDDELD